MRTIISVEARDGRPGKKAELKVCYVIDGALDRVVFWDGKNLYSEYGEAQRSMCVGAWADEVIRKMKRFLRDA